MRSSTVLNFPLQLVFLGGTKCSLDRPTVKQKDKRRRVGRTEELGYREIKRDRTMERHVDTGTTGQGDG